MKKETVRKVVKAALKDSGVKQFELAERLGITQASVSNSINRQRVGADVLINMMAAMGYTLVVGKKNGEEFDPIWELESDSD